MIRSLFSKVTNVIEDQFQRIVSGLKDACLEKIVLNDSTDINIPKLINQKYYNYIGINFEKINEFLRTMLGNRCNAKGKKKEIVNVSEFHKKE